MIAKKQAHGTYSTRSTGSKHKNNGSHSLSEIDTCVSQPIFNTRTHTDACGGPQRCELQGQHAAAAGGNLHTPFILNFRLHASFSWSKLASFSRGCCASFLIEACVLSCTSLHSGPHSLAPCTSPSLSHSSFFLVSSVITL